MRWVTGTIATVTFVVDLVAFYTEKKKKWFYSPSAFSCVRLFIITSAAREESNDGWASCLWCKVACEQGCKAVRHELTPVYFFKHLQRDR
jgi:hypothetical protein